MASGAEYDISALWYHPPLMGIYAGKVSPVSKSLSLFVFCRPLYSSLFGATHTVFTPYSHRIHTIFTPSSHHIHNISTTHPQHIHTIFRPQSTSSFFLPHKHPVLGVPRLWLWLSIWFFPPLFLPPPPPPDFVTQLSRVSKNSSFSDSEIRFCKFPKIRFSDFRKTVFFQILKIRFSKFRKIRFSDFQKRDRQIPGTPTPSSPRISDPSFSGYSLPLSWYLAVHCPLSTVALLLLVLPPFPLLSTRGFI
jgi:hypothetical protein